MIFLAFLLDWEKQQQQKNESKMMATVFIRWLF